MKKLFGTGVALVTPFSKTGDVDYTSLRKLLRHTAKGAHYYVVMGTTGETATIDKKVKQEVLDFVKTNNINNLPIVYGIGGNHTQEVLDTIKDTNLTGIDALLSVSPYYNKPSQEGIYQHFKKVADKSPVPVILYNVPGRTASNLTADTTLRLAQHKNIIGIKEASGNIEQCMKIVAEKPTDFMLISGDDMLTVPLYSIGATGVISVLANAYPVVFKNMYKHSISRNYAKASVALFKLLAINGFMYEEGNPVGIKYVLHKMGICEEYVKLPLVAASNALRKKIEDAMVNLKQKG
jgi:4-hydroxy-tetrahydrodipicolinate synthase